MHEWNLELREARLGPRHPETLLSRRGLSLAYRRAGRLDEAIAMDRRTLELREAKLGPDHRDTIESRVNLVRDYRDAGRLDEAIAVDRRTLELREAALGPDHRDTIQSRSNLILLYQRAGDEARAEPLLRRNLELQEKRGPQSTQVASTLASLGSCLLKQGKSAESEPLLRAEPGRPPGTGHR